ncbi:hypothetical protein Y1Q_0012187 [Alligator mississippiensis]|uniref:Uncharacterized protein n=1 Tax=Alligator mississippiensis TaxID=8496 RepID=A0A151N5C1_ALLMI|nr:hypothetical protein Y1Q_0012187 [Alligator mississippiensis]
MKPGAARTPPPPPPRGSPHPAGRPAGGRVGPWPGAGPEEAGARELLRWQDKPSPATTGARNFHEYLDARECQL